MILRQLSVEIENIINIARCLIVYDILKVTAYVTYFNRGLSGKNSILFSGYRVTIFYFIHKPYQPDFPISALGAEEPCGDIGRGIM